MENSFQDEHVTPEYDTLAAFAGEIVYRLPECDDLTVRKTLQSVYRDFCRKACALRTSRCIALEHGVRAYPLPARTADCVVDCIVEAVFENGMEVGRDGYRADGCGAVVFEPRLLPGEGETRRVMLTCVEIPKAGSERVPRWFLDRHGDALASGALARLFAMSGRRWSDPSMALDEARKYEYALTEARARHHSGGGLSAGRLNYFRKGLIV